MDDPTVTIPVEAWAHAADEGLMEQARALATEQHPHDLAPMREVALCTAARAMCMVRAIDEARVAAR